jgi:3D (Asp-Asp-Asp) domain-containing protein
MALMGVETLVLGLMLVTAYQSVPEQTDDSPFITSIGHHVNPFGCAVSQDMLASGQVKYGDYLCIEGIGCKVVNDTTAPRHSRLVDIWVSSYAEEKALPPRMRKVVRIRGTNGKQTH